MTVIFIMWQGLPTIRAYNAGLRFREEFIGFLDRNGAWWFAFIATARWIGFRLDFISAIMLTAGSMLAMAIHDKVRNRLSELLPSCMPATAYYCVRKQFHCRKYPLQAQSRWHAVREFELPNGSSGAVADMAELLHCGIALQVSPRLVGLALAHVMNLSSTMQWAVRQTAEAENNITSIERMLDYTRLPSEPPRVAEGGGTPPDGWPSSGRIDFKAMSARYRIGLPPVLSDLTFTIKVRGTTQSIYQCFCVVHRCQILGLALVRF